jgi:hypothetical protein
MVTVAAAFAMTTGALAQAPNFSVLESSQNAANATPGPRTLSAKIVREAGVEAYLQVFEGLSYAQYLFDPTAPETKAAFEEITTFLDQHLTK